MKKLEKIAKAAACLYLFGAAMLLFGVNGRAYIDPSVMTYMIQVIAGIVIAVGAAAGFYFRRAKKKAQDVLGIKENKEQESDDIMITKSEAEKPEEQKIES